MGFTPQNPADFDPTMGNYKDLKPFRFWCQKVLPLVYDDSLSYYEVLCKVVDYLNKAMEDVGVLHDDVDALHLAYQQLQSYVNNYFSTLDVQQEINNKLDVMASDGTLDALLLPYFNAYKTEINARVEQQDTTIGGLNDAIATQSANITTLTKRMDGFASLPDGSTAGDAELLDIRIGGNGVTYSSAGNAVRGQYNELKTTESTRYNNIAPSALGIVPAMDATNLLTSDLEITTDFAVDRNGYEYGAVGYSLTDYIEVTPPFYLGWYAGASRNTQAPPPICCYDENKNFICCFFSATNMEKDYHYVADSNIKYIRQNIYPNTAVSRDNVYLIKYNNYNTTVNGVRNTLDMSDLLATNSIIDDSFVLKDGTVTKTQNSVNFGVTDYIPISTPCCVCYASGLAWSNVGVPAICSYDENKQLIRAYYPRNNGDGGTIYFYDDVVKYIRYNVIPNQYFEKSKQYLIMFKDKDTPYSYYRSMVDLDTLVQKYIDRDGTEQDLTIYTKNYRATPYIELYNTDCVITWARGNNDTGVTIPAVAFYDENYDFLYAKYSPQPMTAGSFRLNDPNVKYIRYNLTPPSQTFNRLDDYLIAYTNEYEELDYKIESLANAGVRNKKILTKDGTGDFTTWREATEYCWTHPNTDIYVNGGTYDLNSEYGDEYYANIPTTYDRNHTVGPECGYNCKYIFSAGAKLVFSYTGQYRSMVSTFFSPVNIIGSCEFEDMVIECSDCRYCVHEDIATVLYPAPHYVRVKYVNCNMTHNGNLAGLYSDIRCIGAGGSMYSVSDVIGGTYNCANVAISYHLPSGQDNGVCKVNISGAYVSSSIQTSDYPTEKQGVLYLYVNNCSVGSPFDLGNKTVSTLWNNEVRSA